MTITDTAASVFRDNNDDGTPHRPAKSEIRSLFSDVDTAIGGIMPRSNTIPIVIVAAGGINMLGSSGAMNGPWWTDDPQPVYIYDRSLNQFVTANLHDTEYSIYSSGEGIVTVGGGRNNLAPAFGWRLWRETGRPVYIVFNASEDRTAADWLAADLTSLNEDLASALALSGTNKVDYFLWQGGEADAAITTVAGNYNADLVRLRDAIIAERWWADDSVMIVGSPPQQWEDTAKRDYLISELNTFAGLGYRNAVVAISTSPWFPGAVYRSSSTGDPSIWFSGRALYSLGYYNYFEALPAWKFPSKRTISQHFVEVPGPETSFDTSDPAFYDTTYLAARSLFNLAPSITKIGTRFFVGWTANNQTAAEGKGSYGKIVYSDDEFATIKGNTLGANNGIDFAVNVNEPCLWAAPDGSLWCFMNAHRSAVSSQFDGQNGIWVSVCKNPLSTYLTWSRPRRIAPYGWCQPPIYLEGKWYLPVSYWRSPNGGSTPTFVPGTAGRWICRIDWINGILTETMAIGAENTATSSADELSVWVLPSGIWKASWRTTAGPVYANSIDHGVSWDAPTAWTALGTENTRHRCYQSPSGRYLAAWNAGPLRTNLTLGIDAGRASIDPTSKTVILASDASGYPDIWSDGTNAYIAYDQGSNRTTVTGGGDGGKIYVAKVNELNLTTSGSSSTVTTYVIDAGA